MNKEQLKDKILEYGRKCAQSEAAYITARYDVQHQINAETHQLVYEILEAINQLYET